MRFALSLLALAVPAFSAVIQQVITCNSEPAEIRPQWEKRNDLNLVPLNRTARTGLLDPLREEGIIVGLGPRFANEFIGNVSSNGDLLGCGWGCAVTLLRELPCVYKAIKDKNWHELLDCGVTKKDICKCDTCFPGPVEKYVVQWCQSSDDDKVSDKTSYADFALVGQSDLNIAAFRGDLKTYQVQEVQGVDFCPGETCGSCSCCIGPCVFGQCIGVCVSSP